MYRASSPPFDCRPPTSYHRTFGTWPARGLRGDRRMGSVMKNSLRSLAVSTAALVAMALGLSAADPANFKPDGAFKGSTLTGWRVLGDAEWTASNGELIGKAKPGTNGGWLVMDKAFQDVQLYMNYKCTGECKSGVLLRGQKTPDGGMKGVYVSMSDGDTASYAVTLDATGKETGRTQLNPPARGGGGGAAAPAGGAGRAGAGAPASRSGGCAPAPASSPCGGAQPLRPAPPPARGTQVGIAGRGRPTLKTGDWNETYIAIGTDGPPAGSQVGPLKVITTYGPAAVVAVDESNATGYGAVALYVGGTGEVRYKDFAWRDLDGDRRAEGTSLAALHDAAGDVGLLRMGRDDGRHQQRWEPRPRLRPVLLRGPRLHRAPPLSRRLHLQSGKSVRARHGEPGVRLHR